MCPGEEAEQEEAEGGGEGVGMRREVGDDVGKGGEAAVEFLGRLRRRTSVEIHREVFEGGDVDDLRDEVVEEDLGNGSVSEQEPRAAALRAKRRGAPASRRPGRRSAGPRRA